MFPCYPESSLCSLGGHGERGCAWLPKPTWPWPSHPQVVSSILRNLSWRADINSKKVLREVGSMTALMQCVLRANKVGHGGIARAGPEKWERAVGMAT